MKPIIFGFSRPRKWKPLAAAIMAIDKTNYDHGYTKFHKKGWDCDFIYQSSGVRTNFMGGVLFENLNVIVEEYTMMVPDDVEAAVGNLCVTREGNPYPIKTIIGIGLVKALSFVNAKNPWPSKYKDCIGEQAAILSLGLKIPCPLDFNKVTPKEFRNWLITLPNLERTA